MERFDRVFNKMFDLFEKQIDKHLGKLSNIPVDIPLKKRLPMATLEVSVIDNNINLVIVNNEATVATLRLSKEESLKLLKALIRHIESLKP